MRGGGPPRSALDLRRGRQIFEGGASFASGDGAPMTVALNNLVSSSTGVKEYNVHFAGAIMAALPTLLVYIVAGRYFVRGLMAGSVKG